MDELWVLVGATEVDPFEFLIGTVNCYLAGELTPTDLLGVCIVFADAPLGFFDPASILWRRVTIHVAMYLAGDWEPDELADSLAQICWEDKHELPSGKTVMFGSPMWKRLIADGQVPWPLGSPIWPKPPSTER